MYTIYMHAWLIVYKIPISKLTKVFKLGSHWQSSRSTLIMAVSFMMVAWCNAVAPFCSERMEGGTLEHNQNIQHSTLYNQDARKHVSTAHVCIAESLMAFRFDGLALNWVYLIWWNCCSPKL